MGARHDHGAAAVDVEGELRGSLRRVGLVLLVLGALALSGGLWFLSRSRALATPEARVQAVLEALGEHPADLVALRAAELAAELSEGAAAWWWAGELAHRAGDGPAARRGFERAAELAPRRDEPRRALQALADGGPTGPPWIDAAAADALEAVAAADFPSPGR
ncbi:MAG TPA: hypothetical protein VMT18_14460 [Planctomycetota bacterium]|nr:hypothetical protein [Planctomycetota bacterium]